MCKIANTVLMIVGSLLEQWVSGNSLKNVVALFLVVSPFHFKVHCYRLAA